MTNTLPKAIDTDDVIWSLGEAGDVCCYLRPGTERPMLLLHSINAAPSAFEVSPLFDAPPHGRPLFAPDLPGFGRSTRRDRAYSPEFYADVILACIDQIGVGAVDVLALSTTSEFAARAAIKAPDLVNSLILVSPTGFSRRREGVEGGSDTALRVFGLPGLGRGLYRLLRSRRSVRFFLDQAFRHKAPAAMIDYACATAAQPGAQFAPFYFLSGRFFNPDAVGNLYQHVEQPVLVLYDQDPNISFRYLESMIDSHDNWTLERIPETFGLPHFDEPELTRAAIERFLTAGSL